MAWTTPLTATANNPLTAAQWNASVRDNLLVTPAALATTAGAVFVATGANAIAQRVPLANTVSTSNTVTFTTFGDPATSGPTVTVTSGTQAMVFLTSSVNNSSAGGDNRVDFAVSGATTRSPIDATALIHQTAAANQSHRASVVNMITLTAGSNVFTAKYRITAAGGGTGTFNDRHLVVYPL
jgi:hypothetical protein